MRRKCASMTQASRQNSDRSRASVWYAAIGRSADEGAHIFRVARDKSRSAKRVTSSRVNWLCEWPWSPREFCDSPVCRGPNEPPVVIESSSRRLNGATHLKPNGKKKRKSDKKERQDENLLWHTFGSGVSRRVRAQSSPWVQRIFNIFYRAINIWCFLPISFSMRSAWTKGRFVRKVISGRRSAVTFVGRYRCVCVAGILFEISFSLGRHARTSTCFERLELVLASAFFLLDRTRARRQFSGNC